MTTLVTTMACQLDNIPATEELRITAQQLAAYLRELLRLADDAGRLATPIEQFALPDVQWIDLGEIVRRVFRSSYPISVKSDVELDVSLPRRNVSICADRESMRSCDTDDRERLPGPGSTAIGCKAVCDPAWRWRR